MYLYARCEVDVHVCYSPAFNFAQGPRTMTICPTSKQSNTEAASHVVFDLQSLELELRATIDTGNSDQAYIGLVFQKDGGSGGVGDVCVAHLPFK